MTVLVTGGAGYIGSHTVVKLLEAGEEVVIVDNLSNSSALVPERIGLLTGKVPEFICGDVRDSRMLDTVFSRYDIDAVLHFAGLKSVGESVVQPVDYYDNNVSGSLVLLAAMKRAGVHNLIFSSSATVYGDPETVPLTEAAPTGATTNPYGTSKYLVERILQDVSRAEPDMSIGILRYFNPVGAHPLGALGEDPNGIPNNLLPYICRVAAGRLQELTVFGDDYPTSDGTCIRDYIHVEDLAEGHLCALKTHRNDPGIHVYNLGTGNGYSVLDIVRAFEEATSIPVPYRIGPRRAGDIAVCYADAEKAAEKTGWRAEKTLTDMMRDAWHWQSKNPDGYGS